MKADTQPAPPPLPHWSDVVPLWLSAASAGSEWMIAADFDGTLSELRNHPEDACLIDGAAAVIEQFLDLSPGVRFALISGRAVDDLMSRVPFDQSRLVFIGNHGLEAKGMGLDWKHQADAALSGALASLAGRLRSMVAGMDGVELEDKRLSLSLHYRRARADVAAWLRSAVAGLDLPAGIRLHSGSAVFEFRPLNGIHKGTAMRTLLDRFHIADRCAAFLGDDTTDEDVFRELLPGSLTVRVSPGSYRGAARCSAAGPRDVVECLRSVCAVLRSL